MKSIFYRVWDTQENKYFEPTYEAFNGKLEDLHIGLHGDLFMRTMDGTIHCDSVFPGRFVVEQASHLLDRKGIVIHEGDIVLHNKMPGLTNERYKRVIVFRNGAFGYERFQNKNKKLFQPLGKYYIGNQKDRDSFCEIIGNIHTKPEGIK